MKYSYKTYTISKKISKLLSRHNKYANKSTVLNIIHFKMLSQLSPERMGQRNQLG